MNVLLIGEESAGMRLLRAVAGSRHRLVAVMCSEPKAESGASVWGLAREMGQPTWPAKLVRDPSFGEAVRSERVDVILNAHSLYIIHKEVLGAARIGAFNMHPGPLPRYAGLNGVSWALYRGERTYGVTLHWMTPGIDTGDIAYQSMFPIEDTDTALLLAIRSVQEGIPLALELLKTASEHPEAIPRIEQDLSKREYFGKAIPAEGRLSWNRPAGQVRDFVRACDYRPFASPWGHPRTRLGDREIGIVNVSRTGQPSAAEPGTVGERLDGKLQVACADEWLVVRQILVDGCVREPAGILKQADRLE